MAKTKVTSYRLTTEALAMLKKLSVEDGLTMSKELELMIREKTRERANAEAQKEVE